MSKILIVAEHDGARLNPSTSKCVTCAAKVPGASIDVLVLAADASQSRRRLLRFAGVGKVLVVENAANAESIAVVLAPQVAKVAAGYSHVFGPSTTFGKDLMPRVAALLGVGQSATSWASVARIRSHADLRRQRDPDGRGSRGCGAGRYRARCLVRGRRPRWQRGHREGRSGRRAADPHAVRVAVGCHDRASRLQSAARVVAGGRALGSAMASRSSTAWPTSSVRRSAHRAPPSTRATCE